MSAIVDWDLDQGLSFRDGASWARIELPDDEYVPVMAIQANDREHAVQAVRRSASSRRSTRARAPVNTSVPPTSWNRARSYHLSTRAGSIPVAPGVYKFRDPHGRVIYVGKAKSLRSRLNSYFADVSSLHPRTRQMVTTAGSVEWTVVSTEVEALQLEYNWIKEFDHAVQRPLPRRQDLPGAGGDLNEEYPRLFVYRGPRRKGVRYFGPYSHAWAIRETLDLLLRVFPARTCSAGVFSGTPDRQTVSVGTSTSARLRASAA